MNAQQMIADRGAAAPDSVHAVLGRWAARDARTPAILAPGCDSVSFGALLDRIEYVRAVIGAHGLVREDRIALVAPQGPHTAVAAVAIACSAVCVPLRPGMPEPECAKALMDVRARALVLPAGDDAGARAAARRAGLLILDLYGPASGPGPRTAQPDDLSLLMRTSGTAARPKCVPVTHGQVLARAQKSQRLLGLGPNDRCLNPMPLCYMHGLGSGLLTPLLTGGSVICPVVFDENVFRECLQNLGATWLTAGATHHLGMLEWLRRRTPTHRLRFVRASSAPLPGWAQRELESLLNVPVIESYSSTEAGVITANPPSGTRKPGTVGTGHDGDVAVLDEYGRTHTREASGEVVVRGPSVVSGYDDDTAAPRLAFRDGWYRTGDLGTLDADGYLSLRGRLDEVINRGGEKISPYEVDIVLLDHPAVKRALTFPVPHRTLHQEIAAAVELRFGANPTERELHQHLAARLAPFKLPRRIVIATKLPLGPTGKPTRHGAAKHFGLTGPHLSATPPSPLEQILVAAWRDVLRRDDAGPDDDFFLLGGDSLAALSLLLRIEQELRVQVSLQELMQNGSPRQLAQCLQLAPPASPDIVGIQTAGRMTPIFAVCGRFGYVLRLLLLGRALGPEQPFYGLQPPGMDWESAGCRTVPQMAAHYVERIIAIQPRGPYRLLGTSFGGLMVYEIALQLQAAGREVELLCLVDSEPAACRLPHGIDRGASLPLDAMPDGLGRAEAAGHRVARTHALARSTYVMERRYEGKLLYFLCDLRANPASPDRRHLWNSFATQTLFVQVPGRHGEFHLEPQFGVLCRELQNGVASLRRYA